MDNLAIYLKCNEAIEAGDFATAGALLHDDYVLTGPTSQPAGKGELMALLQAIVTACPDFRFNFRGLEQRGEEIVGRERITCTHTARLDLHFMGLPPVEATGRKVEMPEEPIRAIVKDGKIIREHVESVPGGGLEGFLHQIGAETPAVA